MARPISEQTVVITGASSGIGRATALEFAERGARLVLAARGEAALAATAEEARSHGGEAHVVVTDVASWDDVRRLADEAIDRFGRIDTWVNDAAVIEYATVEDTTVEEMARIIQVNLMGQIHGVKAALPHMQRQGGGTMINVASIEAMRGLPYHAPYAAAKHGVKGFTDALRLELAHDKSPVRVVLVMPGTINTPLFAHARSKLGVKPLPFPPLYEPHTVAEAIVKAAERPQAEIVVGGAGKMLTVLERLSPTLLDWLLMRADAIFRFQRTDQPDDGRDNLFEPWSDPGAVSGEFGNLTLRHSAYTTYVELHPAVKRCLLAALGLCVVALARRANGRPPRAPDVVVGAARSFLARRRDGRRRDVPWVDVSTQAPHPRATM